MVTTTTIATLSDIKKPEGTMLEHLLQSTNYEISPPQFLVVVDTRSTTVVTNACIMNMLPLPHLSIMDQLTS